MSRNVIFVMIAACLAGLPVMSQAAECEKSVTPADNQRLRYQDRGDRCEGLFIQPVAASAHINIVAFFDHMPAFSETLDKTIALTAVGAKSENHISFRAVSARYRQYYRMDAKLISSGRFPWKTDLIKALNISTKDLMVLACDESCDAPEPRLLPISGFDDGSTGAKSRVLTVTSAVDLARIFIKLTRDGQPQPIESDRDILEGQILSAGALKRYYGLSGQAPGTYHIKITAIPRYGDAADQARAILLVP